MPRTMTSGMQAAVAAERGQYVHLVEIDSSGGVLRLCTATQDVAWSTYTWVGSGGVLGIGAVQEVGTADLPGVDLTLSGVEQSIIADLLSYHLRGRAVAIWRAHIDDSGQVVADPLLLFTGFLNEDWTIEEQRDEEGKALGTVTITTMAASRAAILQQNRTLATSLDSHNAMLARAGLATGDTFFRTVPGIAYQGLVWGHPWPAVNPGGPNPPGQGPGDPSQGRT